MTYDSTHSADIRNNRTHIHTGEATSVAATKDCCAAIIREGKKNGLMTMLGKESGKRSGLKQCENGAGYF